MAHSIRGHILVVTEKVMSRAPVTDRVNLIMLFIASRCAAQICAVTIAVLALAGTSRVRADERAVHAPVNVAMCRGCHGIAGYRSAFPEVYPVPKLGGQQAAYIVNALQQYKSGLRMHATMRSIAATLSDQQIAAIAAYYAGGDK